MARVFTVCVLIIEFVSFLVEDLVSWGMTPYANNTTIYKSGKSEGFGIELSSHKDSFCSISRIDADSPAAKIGSLRVGDRVVQVNGKNARGIDAGAIDTLSKSMDSLELKVVKQKGALSFAGDGSEHASCPF